MKDEFKDFFNITLNKEGKFNKKITKNILEGCSVSGGTTFSDKDPYVSFRSSNITSFSLSKELLSKHILLLGGIGVGKTNVFNLLLESLIDNRLSKDKSTVTIIFDTKGDFIKEFYEDGDIVIANNRQYKDKTYYWNIFEEIMAAGDDLESQELMAKEIGKSLFSDRKSASQPFFVNAAMDIFSKTLIHFIRFDRENKKKGKKINILNNQELVKFFQQANPVTYINMCNRHGDFKGALTYFGDGKSNQALGVFGELNSMINDYFIGVFVNKSNEKEFSMRKFVRKKENKKLFIEYDLTVGETLTPMYRLLIDLALKEAFCRQRSEGDIYFLIDEFKLLPKLQHIDDALNFGRSLGVKVIAGLQNITQLYDIYGESRGAVIASGFSNIFAFKMVDFASRDYISKLFGKNYYSLNYWNAAGELVDENREGYTVEDWELMDLKVGHAVIGLANHKPFYFVFNEYKKK